MILLVVYLTVGAVLTAVAAVDHADQIRATRFALRRHRGTPVAALIEAAAVAATVLAWPRIVADVLRAERERTP